MKQNTRKLFSLLLALVMAVTLAVPAFAAEGEGEAPEKELRFAWLMNNEEGKFFLDDVVLESKDNAFNGELGMDQANDVFGIFFIWDTAKGERENFVVPKGDKNLTVRKLDAADIAEGAKETQYYVKLHMKQFKDSVLTADDLSMTVSAVLPDFAFYSSEEVSSKTLLGNDVKLKDLTDGAVYFSVSEGADTVTKVEQDPNMADSNQFYDVEAVKDGVWKVALNEKGKIALNNGQGGLFINLILEVTDAEGNTREGWRSINIVGETQGTRLWLIQVNEEMTEDGKTVYLFDKDHTNCENQTTQVHTGEDHARVAFFATLADGESAWTEDGKLNIKAFTPVEAKSLKASSGLSVKSVSDEAKEGDEFGEYFVRISVAENDKEYKLTSGDNAITIDSGLPYVGVYSAATASFETWLGEWGYGFHPAYADEPYYIISIATDAENARHLVDAKLSTENLQVDCGNSMMDLEKVSDDVYKLSFKSGTVLKAQSFHVELDLSWTDFMGHTWTDNNSYFGNFDPTLAVLASDDTLTSVDADPLPYADVADKVSTTVSMNAGQQKTVNLYVGSRNQDTFLFMAYDATCYRTSDPELTITYDENDPTKFTLSASKAGTYEIWCGGENWDYPNMKLYHADGTEYTQEEWDEFDKKYMCFFLDDGTMLIRTVEGEDAEYVSFEEMFPGEKYEIKSLGIEDFGFHHLTVTVNEAKPQTANPTNNALTVNGEAVTPTAYKIDNANFFKLRDLAALLNGTEKQFNVGYDEETHTATITAGEGYTKQDSDLQPAPAGSQEALPTNDSVQLNGEAVQLTVYKVNNANFFKLRDLGEALDFYVGYDDATKTMSIDTTKGYEAN